jgi:hypothetical protein
VSVSVERNVSKKNERENNKRKARYKRRRSKPECVVITG